MSFIFGDVQPMPIPDEPPRYQVFLLRCWEEHSEHPELDAWRFSLQDPSTGQRRGFASLEALFAFLTNQFGAQSVECAAEIAAHGE
jgi:hypothetical protein